MVYNNNISNVFIIMLTLVILNYYLYNVSLCIKNDMYCLHKNPL